MKTLFRWLVRIVLALAGLTVLLLVILLLLKDTIAKSYAERNIRDRTGMDARIQHLEVGLLTPTLNLEGLRIYNSAEFGGGTLLEMPELRVEYVIPENLRSGKLRFKTVRLNISEINVVKSKEGNINLAIPGLDKDPTKRPGHTNKTDSAGVDFGGIDTLYLSIGKLRYTDLSVPGSQPTEIPIGIKNEVGRNLRTEADIANWFSSVVLKLYMQNWVKGSGSSPLRSLFPESPKRR